MRPAISAALCCALFAVVVPVSSAQSPTGTIDGVIVDAQGAVLPGVTVTVTAAGTGAIRTATSDDLGRFAVPLLAVGVYSLSAELSGFDPATLRDLQLTIGQTRTFRIELTVSGLTEAVTVVGRTPVLETRRTHASATVGEDVVQHLPVNGRNFIDFTLLTPGVTRDVRTGDLSFAGQRGTLNSLVVDGADDNNTFFGQAVGRTGSGRAPYQFSQDAVKEFQVNSNGLPAEYGRAGAAVVNVVTKSGTNALAGSVFEFFRDKRLNANNAINKRRGRPRSPYHYHQFGATAGGPLQPNRHFYFVNYDGQRNTQPNLVFLNLPASTPGDAATLAGIARLSPLAASWTRKLDQDVYFAKTDHELDAGGRLSLRYNHQDFTGAGFENGGAQNAFEHTGDSLVRTRTFNAVWSRVFGSAFFNETRLQYARDREPGTANSDAPEATVQQDGVTVLTIGRNNFSPRETAIARWQIADTLAWVRRRHTVKAGVDVQFDDIVNDFPGFFGGAYTFRSLASFASGRPAGADELYQQNFAGPGTNGSTSRPDLREYSAFLQDEWKPAGELTINAGLRYDLVRASPPPVRNPDPQLLAAGIDTSRLRADTNNWGPRLGVAWAPRGRHVAVRGGWGLFYGRTPSIMLGTAHTGNGLSVVALTFTGDRVPAYPDRFTAIPDGGTAARPTIFYVDRDFRNARLMQAHAALEWEVLVDTTLTVTYLFVDGSGLPRSIDRNLGTRGSRLLSEGTTSYPYHVFGADRPFTNFSRVIAFESSAVSRYDGLTVELNRRLAENFQGRLAYTLGRVVDTVPDATAVVAGNAGDDVKYASNPVDFKADRTYGNNDQRHRLVLSGLYTTNGLAESLSGFARAMTEGWTFGLIATAQSGQPYTARVGAVDLNNDGNARNDIAPGTVRNQFRLPAQITVDPRVARDIPFGRVTLQMIFEVFNLFDRDAITGVDTTLYGVTGSTLTRNGTFRSPVAAADNRIIQLAARVVF